MPPSRPPKDASREALADAYATIAKLRYLWVVSSAELHPRLLPRESLYDRLDYLLSRVDTLAALRDEQERRNRA